MYNHAQNSSLNPVIILQPTMHVRSLLIIVTGRTCVSNSGIPENDISNNVSDRNQFQYKNHFSVYRNKSRHSHDRFIIVTMGSPLEGVLY